MFTLIKKYVTIQINLKIHKRTQIMARHKKVSPADITDIQLLFSHGVKACKIAEHFSVSAPTITYHTKPIEPKSVTEILTKLKRI